MLGNEFLGFDFIWFMGVTEDINDPKSMSRVKVRIFGFHSQDYNLLPTDKLPWSQVLMPCTSASQGGVGTSPHGLKNGSWVMGFFADGRKGQFPIILGSFHGVHSTSYVQSRGAGVSSGLGPNGAVNLPTTDQGNPIDASQINPYSGDIAPFGVDPNHLSGNQGANLGLTPGNTDDLVTIKSSSGASFKVASATAPQFQGFINALEKQGYKVSSGGGYANRPNVNDRSRISQHAYGNAIDINPDNNGNGDGKIDLPANTSKIAADYGLSWGNGFSGTPDAMHFEVSRLMSSDQLGNVNKQYVGETVSPIDTSTQPSDQQLSSNNDYSVNASNAAFGGGSQNYNPMNQYSGEATSINPQAKSPDDVSGTTKVDINTLQDSTRGDAPYRSGDGTAFAEKLSSDIGTNPNVLVSSDGFGNSLIFDSTPGAERFKITGPGSYMEIDAKGNMTTRAGGDHQIVSRGNVSIGAVSNMSLSAGKGAIRGFAQGGIHLKTNGSASIDADGGHDIHSNGDGVLRWSGDLIIQAKSIKLIASGGGIDVRAPDEINMESGSNMNFQTGGTMALESKGSSFISSHGDLVQSGDGKTLIGSGGEMSLKSGQDMKIGSGGNVNLKGSNVNAQGSNINLKGTASADLFTSPNVPQMPEPSKSPGQSPSEATSPSDVSAAMAAQATLNKNMGRSEGSGGGGVAAHARAPNSIDPEPTGGSPSDQSASLSVPTATPSSTDTNAPVNDSAPIYM